MDEKILIKSEQYNVKKFFKIMLIIGAILSVLVFVVFVMSQFSNYDYYQNTYEKHLAQGHCYNEYMDAGSCYECENAVEYSSGFDYLLSNSPLVPISLLIAPIGVFALIGGLIYLWLRSYELTITDKRIFGKVAWGKRVDLPVDSVSATASLRFLNGVSVATSSGRISFRVLKNADAIYQVISNLLIERQQEKSNPAPVVEAPKSDEADQLKKYKELLDSGVITQEEFDAKKKQLLGL